MQLYAISYNIFSHLQYDFASLIIKNIFPYLGKMSISLFFFLFFYLYRMEFSDAMIMWPFKMTEAYRHLSISSTNLFALLVFAFPFNSYSVF